MKKSIYISGILSANLIMFGSLFKIQHWPGANVMIVLAIFLFCFFFLPASLINMYQGQPEKKHKFLYIITFFVFFITMMGVLFKVMHWPGAAFFLVIGIPLPFVLFLPVYLYYTGKDKNPSTINFLGIAFGLIFLAVISVLLSINVSKNLFVQSELNFADNENVIGIYQSASKDLPSGTLISQKANDLCNYIDDLKCEMLITTENDLCRDNKIRNYKPADLINVENEEVFSIVFKKGGVNKIEILKEKVNSYKETLLGSAISNVDLNNLVNSLFDVQAKSGPENEMTSWEEEQFPNKQLVFVLENLSRIEANARIVENEALENLN